MPGVARMMAWVLGTFVVACSPQPRPAPAPVVAEAKDPAPAPAPVVAGECLVALADPGTILQTKLGVGGALERSVTATLAAASSLTKLATKLEADVAEACGRLAKDLGARDADLGGNACDAAQRLLGEARAKAGGTLRVMVVPPKCSLKMSAMGACAARCDSAFQTVGLECEAGELSGSCTGHCKGSCLLEAGAPCDGVCSGTCSGGCDAELSGQCQGKCEGTCDGKTSTGRCKGRCEGKCTSGASGSCGGKCSGACSGSCQIPSNSTCKGTCSGGCSDALLDPRCSGTVRARELGVECAALCDAEINQELACLPARVRLAVDAAADAQASAKLKTVVEAHLPAFLAITLVERGRFESVASNVKASITRAKAAFERAGVASCFERALQKEADASARIRAAGARAIDLSRQAGAG